jgi:hypothetical protein
MGQEPKRNRRHKRRAVHQQKLLARSEPSVIQLSDESDLTLDVAAGEGESKLRRFRGMAYGGKLMQPPDFSLPIVVDLAGMEVRSQRRPMLLNHDSSQIVGHTESVTTTTQVTIDGVISGTGAAADEVTANGDNGFPWKLSIGASVKRLVRVDQGEKVAVNGHTFTGPIYVARKSKLNEISFLAIGADDTTYARLAASGTPRKLEAIPMEFDQWLETQGFDDPSTLSEKQQTSLKAMYDAEQAATATDDTGGGGGELNDPPPEADTVDATGSDGVSLEDQAKDLAAGMLKKMREEAAGEMRRQSRIAEICADKHPDIQAKAIADNWTDTKVELEVLRAERPMAPAIHDGGQELTAGVLEAGLLFASGKFDEEKLVPLFDEKTVERARKMQPMSIPRLFQDFLRAHGQSPPHSFNDDTIRMALRAEMRSNLQATGFTSMSLSGILGNVANKSMLDQYNSYASVAKTFAAPGSVSDFKQVTRYRLVMTGNVEKVGPDGHLEHGAFDEDSYTAQAETWGKMVALTRVMIINDDLGAFLTIPRMLGRSCAIALERETFTVWLSNTGTFFGSGNSNVGAGNLATAPTDSLEAADLLFNQQTDTNSDPIGILPRYLLVPITLSVVASQLYQDTEIAVVGTAGTVTKRMKSNPFKGRFMPLASPWLENTNLTNYSASTWYLTSDPADVAAIEISYLNGVQTPTIENSEVDFSQLGMQWRCYFDFGVDYQDPRAAVRMTES